ncbi:hypothetical protein [Xenorhabdus bovienii]|uniref:hypothetical protein n=1 Tax=Xenorhabdus bovienii TaxID=40576 RepID=UPI0023B2C411|nr:hypothetical protein [Xenorhabdus bovienii]MDE9455562.1 hypothetical protein [Xenorhabdus bovienii]
MFGLSKKEQASVLVNEIASLESHIENMVKNRDSMLYSIYSDMKSAADKKGTSTSDFVHTNEGRIFLSKSFLNKQYISFLTMQLYEKKLELQQIEGKKPIHTENDYEWYKKIINPQIGALVNPFIDEEVPIFLSYIREAGLDD